MRFRVFILLLDLVVLAAILGVLVGLAIKHLGLPFWTYYVTLVLLAAGCYVTDAMLTMAFIRKRAPEYLSNEENEYGFQKWELTAGTGIVPKWVSFIGLASFSCLLALLMPFVAPMFR